MKIRRIIFMAATMLMASAAISYAESGHKKEANAYGYYKDVFMDAGINLVSQMDLPAVRYLNLSMETFRSATHSPMKLTIMDTVIQNEMFCGNPWDENGVLLYPDGEPRYRMIYMNGGKAKSHGRSLTPEGRDNIRKFVENGGSYVGTCAGMFIASDGIYYDGEEYQPKEEYLSLWPGTTHNTALFWNKTSMKVVEGSPLLRYYDFGGDMQIDSIFHNGGGYAYYGEGSIIPEGTEPLLTYVYDTVGLDVKPRQMHGQVSTWAYKKNAESGRLVLTGSHPEDDVTGDRLQLMAAMMQYAMDGNGIAKVKAALQPGVLREMNKDTEDNDPLFTKVGDLQYHHFTVDVPAGTKQMVVYLAGYENNDNFNLSLCAKQGDFAFHHNTELKNVSLGCTKTLVIDNPKSGKWYISVRCENTADTREGEYGTEYYGDRSVLNGVPYSIKVEFGEKASDIACAETSGSYGREGYTGRDGYYKDIFMDSGIKLTARKYLPSATHLEATIETFWRTQNTLRDTIMQQRCIVGTEEDKNGILLYPDGAPRFRVIYVNGGLATRHGNSLGPYGRVRMRKFVANGGSFVGTCAGGFIGSTGIIQADDSFEVNKDYLAIWPGRTRDTYLAQKRFKMYMDDNCSLLKYYDFGGDKQVDSIFHNNGGYAALTENDPIPVGTEPLLRVDYDTIPRKGPSIDNQVTCWAYKAAPAAGNVILMSSHPEAITTGERMHLMASFMQYAMDKNGDPVVKGNLVPGAVREMNKDTEDADPAFTKIGDRQYHHFTVDIPKRVKKVTIILQGYEGEDNFDLTLAANEGDFAFHKSTDMKNVSLGCSKTLVVDNPKAGKLYISVFCETTVESYNGDNGVLYTGRTDVLNGVPYKIRVELEK